MLKLRLFQVHLNFRRILKSESGNSFCKIIGRGGGGMIGVGEGLKDMKGRWSNAGGCRERGRTDLGGGRGGL